MFHILLHPFVVKSAETLAKQLVVSRCQSRRGHVLCDPNIVSLMSAVDFGRSAAAIDLHVCRPDSFSRKPYAPFLLDKFKKVHLAGTGYFRRESLVCSWFPNLARKLA